MCKNSEVVAPPSATSEVAETHFPTIFKAIINSNLISTVKYYDKKCKSMINILNVYVKSM